MATYHWCSYNDNDNVATILNNTSLAVLLVLLDCCNNAYTIKGTNIDSFPL